jgi:glycosyltransferase involved in cell wall biosynthesis
MIMELLFGLLVAVNAVEAILWVSPVCRLRKPFAALLIAVEAIVYGFLIGFIPSVTVGIFVYFGLYKIFNILRILESKLNQAYIYRSTKKSAYSLGLIQLFVLLVAYASNRLSLTNGNWLTLIALVEIIGALVVLGSTIRHINKSSQIMSLSNILDKDMPTVTVAIPARNETEDLQACLESLIRCKYPKLEIIVLDDCSQVRRTPDIIRAYANNGVKFISGEVPPEKWLAKNYAYAQLAAVASGEIVLFCGVDTRFEEESIRNLVKIMLERGKDMLSVIPTNSLPKVSKLESMILQSSRYAWELALPRKLINRPAVLSTCWLIKTKQLKQSGSFEAYANSISPESYFARNSIKRSDGYSFIISPLIGGVSCDKGVDDQRDTAVRTRYPQLHRRMEVASLLAVAELGFLVLPLILSVLMLTEGSYYFSLTLMVVFVLQTIAYSKVLNLTYRKSITFGLIALPFAALYDVIILMISMYKYEFGSVVWKERNVCVPVMNFKHQDISKII